jgi:ribonuclease HI
MLFCPYARDVWSKLKRVFSIKLARKSFVNPKTWIFDFLSRSSSQNLTLLAVAFWHLWSARNGVRKDDHLKDPCQLSEQIKAYTTMIELHLSKPVANHRCVSKSSPPKWSPPPEGTVLINVDAALFKSSNRMGAGVVIRNHRGECLVACSELLLVVTMPELAEALALRRALALASEEGFEQVMVASDCLSVVQRIKSTTQDHSYPGVIIQDMKKMASSFVSCSFFHISRKLNESAHVLAKRSELYGFVVFRDVPPDCIREILCNDLL